MWFKHVVISFSLVAFLSFSNAYHYKSLLLDDEIFSKCENVAENVLDIDGTMDMSELTIEANSDTKRISGNATFIWAVEPTDRIQVVLQTLHYDHGSWQPTLYKISSLNFCSIMFDKNQYWYQAWLIHLKNIEDIKDKCVQPGTKLIHEPFDLEFYKETYAIQLSGLYKVQVSAIAYDKFGIMRPISICVAVKLEFVRL